MKRVQITDQIGSLVRTALGSDIDTSSVHVYEAIALNTLPLRKRHPLYLGARVDRGVLLEMAAELQKESRPVQIEHSSNGGTPLGRVFHGSVIDTSYGAELRVLFFLDATEAATIQKVESGTVDQVSISILPKQILNSVSGFDYIGPDSTFENVMTGSDNDGNTLNEGGVYARLVGLDAFFEMSLVGQGAAQNARIVQREQSHFGSSFQKLAASGVDPNALVLNATVKADTMDLNVLIDNLTTAKAEIVTLNSGKAVSDTQIASLTSEIATLTAKLADAGNATVTLAEKDAQIATLTGDKATAATEMAATLSALKGVAKNLLVASGKLTEEPPETLVELSAMIDSAKTGLAAALVAGGRSAAADSSPSQLASADLSAFQTTRK